MYLVLSQIAKYSMCGHKLFRCFTTGLIVITGILLSITSVTAATKELPRDPLEHFFHQSFNNLQEEAETAREEGKMGIFVMFNDPNCPWCAKMKATVLNQVAVQDYYRKYFRLIHLDTSGDTTMVNFNGEELMEKDFAFKIHRVRATPVFMFFDLEGNVIMRYTGATRSVDEFLWLGEFIVNGHYKNEKFAKFKKAKLASRDK